MRSFAHRSLVLSLLGGFASLSAACASHHQDEAASSSETDGIVDTSFRGPYGPSVNADLPAVGSGGFQQKNAANKLIDGAQATYTNEPNLAAAASTDRAFWTKQAGRADTVASSAFVGHIGEALTAADAVTDPSALDAGGGMQLFKLLALFGAPPPESTTARAFYGFAPVRARALRREWSEGGTGKFGLAPHWTSYPDPKEFAETRERGARLYCAARNVQKLQGPNPMQMGKQAAFTTTFLGKKLEFLVVEPSVTMAGPQKFLADPAGVSVSPANHFLPPGVFDLYSPDGAQAFTVPMQFATRITPIAGLLPGLDEMRYPVVLTTGDSEVMTRAKRRTGPGPVYGREYRTASHVDAVATGWEHITMKPPAGGAPGRLPIVVPVFTTGFLTVSIGIGLTFDLGKPSPGNDRLIHESLELAPSPRPERESFSGGHHFLDGPWLRRPGCHEIDPCMPWDFAVESHASTPLYQFTNAGIGPMAIRADQDDDHSLETATSLALSGAIYGDLGFTNIGPFSLNLDIAGKMTGTIGQSHLVRDALIVDQTGGAAVPSSVVTIRPRTTASVTLDDTVATLTLAMDLGWPIGTLDWTQSLFTIPGKTLASYDSEGTGAWPESSALRIGTGSPHSNVGNPMKLPRVATHLPGGTDVQALDADVDTCLADETPLPATPPACGAAPKKEGPTTGNVCLYTPGQFSPAACSDIKTTVTTMGLGGEEASCMAELLGFLCTPVSHVTPWTSISHIVNLGDPNTMAKIGALEKQCGHAAAAGITDPAAAKAKAKAFIDGRFRLGLCDASAQLISTEMTSADDPSAPPPVTSADPCH